MTATLELPVIPETGTRYDHCAAWMERRLVDGTPIVSVGGTRYPMTRSGDALLVTMPEEEFAALQPGDVAISWPMHGEAVVVRRVREGCAYDKGEQPYVVPVVEGEPCGAYAVGGLLTVQLLEAA